MISFENSVPETWTGLYEKFYDLIPDKEKYWTLEELTFFEAKTVGNIHIFFNIYLINLFF